MTDFHGRPHTRDHFIGNEGDDRFFFAIGDFNKYDVVEGGGGDDTLILSGSGSVTAADLAGVSGVDRIELGKGDVTIRLPDSIVEDTNGFLVNGGRGQDVIDGHLVRDQFTILNFYGQAGDDTLIGGASGDCLFGGKGVDHLIGGAGDDVLDGGSGADVLDGGDGNDELLISKADAFAGATITGGAGIDRIEGSGSIDFRNVTLSGVETIEMNFYYRPDHVSVTMFASQLLQLHAFVNSNTDTATHLRIIMDVDDLSDGNRIGGVSSVTFVGTAADNHFSLDASQAIVEGRGGDDVISASSNCTALGGNGDDHIEYMSELTQHLLDGGRGNDTLFDVTNSFGESPQPPPLTFDLTSHTNQLISDNTDGLPPSRTILHFENLDFSESSDQITVQGDKAANILLGGLGDDVLIGGGGDDVLDGGSDRLEPGYDDTDTLTGGSGADIFRWMTPTGSDSRHDIVTDFKPGLDHLEFAHAVFGFTGASFDTRVVAKSTSVSIAGADLIEYTGGPLNGTSQVIDYLRNADGSTRGQGVFVVGTNSAGEAMLFHSSDESGGTNSVTVEVAQLDHVKASHISLGDFLFV